LLNAGGSAPKAPLSFISRVFALKPQTFGGNFLTKRLLKALEVFDRTIDGWLRILEEQLEEETSGCKVWNPTNTH